MLFSFTLWQLSVEWNSPNHCILSKFKFQHPSTNGNLWQRDCIRELHPAIDSNLTVTHCLLLGPTSAANSNNHNICHPSSTRTHANWFNTYPTQSENADSTSFYAYIVVQRDTSLPHVYPYTVHTPHMISLLSLFRCYSNNFHLIQSTSQASSPKGTLSCASCGKVYPLSIPEQKAMEEYIEEALKLEFICPSTYPTS